MPRREAPSRVLLTQQAEGAFVGRVDEIGQAVIPALGCSVVRLWCSFATPAAIGVDGVVISTVVTSESTALVRFESRHVQVVRSSQPCAAYCVYIR